MAKQPKSSFEPPTEKSPRISSDPSGFYSKKPSWRLRSVELVDPFGWHDVDRETIIHIREKLSDFETMTWGAILNGKQNHNVNIDRLCKDARDRLNEKKLFDLEQVLSLRLTGKQRVWGILSEGVCTLLWWDPEHRVCPSIKG